MATYQLDPAHSSAHFSVRHLMIATVRGQFSGLSGNLNYDPANAAASSVEVVIDATTISTQEPQRDAHLKSSDFLDIEKYPTIAYKSRSVTDLGNGAGRVVGDLTLHGVTREVILDIDEASPEVTDPWGNLRLAFNAHTKIKRSEFGLTWNNPLANGGVTVGDDISITLDVQFVRPAS
ncbi:MAG TPA: YceI family protein [Capsulimonadaceae bacterium]|nr:YceI family protein [Capsulimonadaceae bacterium]